MTDNITYILNNNINKIHDMSSKQNNFNHELPSFPYKLFTR